MSTNQSQIGHTSVEPLINDMETETNIDQLLSVGIVATSQSSIQLNLTNMIPSQIPTISNHQEDEFSRKIRETQQRQEEQQERQRQQRERQQQQRRYEDREERRYIGWLLRLYERNPERYRQELERQAYIQRRSPTFDERMEEQIEDQLLEAYYLEKMDPKERWLHENLNKMERISALEQQELMKDEIEQLHQINEVEKWKKEKLKQMNTIKERDQQQLQHFEEILPLKPLVSIQDEIEQLHQINQVETVEKEKLHQINQVETIEKEKLKYKKTRTEWDQEQLREIERIPIPEVNDPIYDQIEQLQQIDAIEKWQEEEEQQQQQRSQEEIQQLEQ